MHVVASSLFCMISFPHQRNIVTVDHMSFFASCSSDGNVLYVKHNGSPYESVAVGLFKYSSLMGIFSLTPPHVASVNMVSIKSDPCVIPSPACVDTWGKVMPLSTDEINYVEIFLASFSISFDSSVLKTSLDMYSQSPWLSTLESLAPLDETFTNEGIMDVISLKEPP